MKKPTICLLFVLCFANAFGGPVPAAWKARYKQLVHTMETKNFKAFQAMCSDDLVWVQVDGTKKNRKETMAEMEGMFQADKFKGHEKLLKVVSHRDTVDVHCEVFFKMDVKGKSQMQYHSFCVDTWKKIGGKWLIVKTADQKVEVVGGV